MRSNVGLIDRIIRILAAIIVGVLYFTNQITGAFAIFMGIIAAVFLLTAVAGFCPLYLPLGISTKKHPSDKTKSEFSKKQAHD